MAMTIELGGVLVALEVETVVTARATLMLPTTRLVVVEVGMPEARQLGAAFGQEVIVRGQVEETALDVEHEASVRAEKVEPAEVMLPQPPQAAPEDEGEAEAEEEAGDAQGDDADPELAPGVAGEDVGAVSG